MNTRRALHLSLVANSLLLAACGLLIWPTTGSKPKTPAQAASPEPPPVSIAKPPVPDSPPTSKPFHWSQLESADYRTYIANLRGVGCPEQTIRDIVTADVDSSLYAAKREQLRQRLAAAGNGGSSVSRQGLEAEQQKLWQEEMSLVNALLGVRPESQANVAADSSSPSQQPTQADKAAATPAIMPLAFLNRDTNTFGLNETQLAALDRLRRQFVSDLGGDKLDPTSPEYAARWQQAQPRLDQRLRAVLGQEVYRKLQLQGARQALIPGGAQ